MIHVEPPGEPADFEERVRIPCNRWLSNNQHSNDFPDHWKHCFGALAEGFDHLCGYSAMHVAETGAVVDHYLCKSNHRNLTYEWSNYRYASSRINSRKGACDDQVLDPFEVEDGWFEVQLGSWQLIMTAEIPDGKREVAQHTMDRLWLQTGRDVINHRRKYYKLFLEGVLTTTALRCVAPLIYRAVHDALKALQPCDDQKDCFNEFIAGDISILKLERDAPRIAAAVREKLPPC
jgi:hypothetical protein